MQRLEKPGPAAAIQLFFCLLAAYGGGLLEAQGYPPEQALSHLKAPEGFEVQLFASEPRVRQPVAIEFDDRGRLWVVQYLQYPNPAGLRRVKVDRFSRTLYDRVPEPPPRGPRGEDRVTILEDSDGDGRADSSKDFVTGLNLASGIAFGRGGVFVLQAPYLLFYPDRDGDDVPDSDPTPLLAGFGMDDASSVANSLVWGPDGWLYGAQGSTVTANVRGVVFQQGVWRYRPETDRFELFYEGGGNTWGLDFDERGNLIASTNMGGYVMLHGVEGGYFWKLFEKHGPLSNPYAYGYLDHVPYEGFQGGHVTAGGIVYDGDSFPPELRGKLIAANVLSHAVYWHTLTPRGSTFTARHSGTLLASDDTWCAPCDVTMGPDGAVYVADWYDQRTAHPDPDAQWDRSNGRIYRIQARGAKPAQRVRLDSAASADLVALLSSSNGWVVRRARRILQERRDAAVVPRLRALSLAEGTGRNAREALWVLLGRGGLGLTRGLLRHGDDCIRGWTVRAIAEAGPASAGEMDTSLIDLARSDPSPFVRLELAAGARKLAGSVALGILHALASRSEDAEDPYLPLCIWWALEKRAVSECAEVLELFTTEESWGSAIARDQLLPRLARRYMAEGSAPALEACARIYATAPAAAKASVTAAFDKALEGRSLVVGQSGPYKLTEMLARASLEHPGDATLLRVLVRLGNEAARSRAVALAVDASAAGDLRLAAVRCLTEIGGEGAFQAALRVFREAGPEPLRAAALEAAQRSSSLQVAEQVLAAYAGLEPSLRSRARHAMLSRPEWASLFLDAVEKNKVPSSDVPVDDVRRIALHADPGLDVRARRLWGRFQAATPEEKLAEVRRLQNDLRAGPGDAAKGRELFVKHCATCHRLFGEGKEIGPDLTSANRKDREFMLVSLVDPNVQIRKEYSSHVVATTDGRLVTGRIAREDAEGLDVLGADGGVTRLSRSEVGEVTESPVSLMPEGLIQMLTPQELRDLFACLEKDH